MHYSFYLSLIIFVTGIFYSHSSEILRKLWFLRKKNHPQLLLFQHLPTSRSLSVNGRSENVRFAQQDGLRVIRNIIILFRSMTHSFGERYQHLCFELHLRVSHRMNQKRSEQLHVALCNMMIHDKNKKKLELNMYRTQHAYKE